MNLLFYYSASSHLIFVSLFHAQCGKAFRLGYRLLNVAISIPKTSANNTPQPEKGRPNPISILFLKSLLMPRMLKIKLR